MEGSLTANINILSSTTPVYTTVFDFIIHLSVCFHNIFLAAKRSDVRNLLREEFLYFRNTLDSGLNRDYTGPFSVTHPTRPAEFLTQPDPLTSKIVTQSDSK